MKQPEVLRNLGKDLVRVGGVFAIVFVLLAFFFDSSDRDGMKSAKYSAAMQTTHAIGLALYSYGLDHQGHYPEGKTSTEVFQQLMDGGYVTDPQVFYFPLPGKVRGDGEPLKAENVSYDVTCCIDSSASAGLPVIFLTGYKISYQAGAAAVPIAPYQGRSWSQWFHNERFWRPFIAVYYMNMTARDMTALDDGTVPNFIPADFDPKGKTYRQLTP